MTPGVVDLSWSSRILDGLFRDSVVADGTEGVLGQFLRHEALAVVVLQVVKMMLAPTEDLLALSTAKKAGMGLFNEHSAVAAGGHV